MKRIVGTLILSFCVLAWTGAALRADEHQVEEKVEHHVEETTEPGVEDATDVDRQVDHGDHGAHAGWDGEHWSLAYLLPGAVADNLRALATWPNGATWYEHNPHPHISHVIMALVAFLLGMLLIFAASKRLSDPEAALVPDKRLSATVVFDIVAEGLLGLMSSMMPRDKALRFLPLIMAFAVFIFLSNFLGLVPGFLPATDNLNTTLALGIVSFLAYNYWGIRQHGLVAHLKHFAGPILWLAPLMIPIEIISHFVRPLSLAFRLMGNMFGDHMVLGIFLGIFPLLLPLPVMVLGLIVVTVQTLVFTLLSIVYIALAVEEHEHHDDHAEHGEAHAHAH
ncbi:MAG: F0F1 ATP synthase subunit A [Deltaproteobacteria bacterium]|nr:F0F1 ATP synthase subunit A [Deltaproteobacteria bacterium]MCB9788438.1 F0F1 ATP synthase subunit A [Deltaproteobacteria bacterium]